MQRNKIGEFIQTVRKERNLTQKELGEQIGVSDKTKKSVISVLKKSVLPAGSFIAFFEAVLVMGFFSKSDALGPNLAVVFLAPVYALLIHLVLIPIDERLQKH